MISPRNAVLLSSFVVATCFAGLADVIRGPFIPETGNWHTVTNGGFESPPQSLPVLSTYTLTGDWYLFTSPGSSGTAAFAPEAAYRGSAGVRIRPTSTYNGPGIALTLGQLVPVIPGRQYVLSGFIRRLTPDGSASSILLDLWGASGDILVYSDAVPDWQFVYGVFTPGGSTVGIRATNGGATGPDDAWDVDELAITPLEAFRAPERAGVVPPEPPRLLNINFGTDGTPARRGPAATGFTGDDVWNRYSRDDGAGGFRSIGTLHDLDWSDGSASPVDLAIANAPGAWSNEYPDAMFGIYLYPLGGGPNVTVTLRDLPVGRYTVYAYGHGGPPDIQNTVFNLQASGVDYGDRATASDASWKSPQWIEGAQYVRFSQVFVGAERSMILTAKPGAHPQASINGLQLVFESAESLALYPAPGLFTNRVDVRILGGGAGLAIHYTTDGSEPTASSPVYADPVRLTAAATVRARVFEGTEPRSEILTGEYLRVYAVNDGIPAAWREQYFGPGYLTDPRVAADADPDDDGADNLQEFGNGSNPLDPLSGFAVGVRLVPSITWHSVPGTAYRVLRKDRLSDPEWAEVDTVTASADRTTYNDASVTDVPRYYLIEAIRP